MSSCQRESQIPALPFPLAGEADVEPVADVEPDAIAASDFAGDITLTGLTALDLGEAMPSARRAFRCPS